MLKKLVALTILIFACHFSYSQLPDSLYQIIHSSKGDYAKQKENIREFLNTSSFTNFDNTVNFVNEAIQLSKNKKDSAYTGELINARGTVQYFAGNFDKAAKDFYESIRILKAAGSNKELGHAYNGLAKLYRKTKDLELSMENYDKAFAIFKSLKDSAGMSMILNESGVVFEYKKEYEKALGRYQSSLDIARLQKDSVGISYALSFMAGVFIIEEKYKEAEDYLLQSLEIRQRRKDSLSVALNYTDLGMAMSASGNYAKAKDYYAKSNSIATKLKYPELLASNYSELSSIAEKQKDYEKAFHYFKIKNAINDSLFGLAKTKQIEELSTQYQTQKKEQQIEIQKEIITRKNLVIIAVISILLLTILLGISFYNRRKLKQQSNFQQLLFRQQQEATLAVMEAEEKERQRIAQDLHDGVGQMMSAAKMNLSALENDMNFSNETGHSSYKRIISLVDESCKEVRNVSHNMMPIALHKNSLSAAIKAFVDQLDNSVLKVHVFTEGIEEPLDSNTEMMLYRIVQECVNNVIKHSKATNLDISVIKDATEISITIEDNGIGFNTDMEKEKNGLGLQGIRAKVRFLQGELEFNSTEGKGTVVIINIPLNSVS